VRIRQFIERHVIGTFVQTALARGHNISVHNGEEIVLWQSRKANEIMRALMTTDDDHLYVDATRDADGRLALLGEVVLIYGNSGYDVINDYHMALEPLMSEVDKVVDYWDSEGPWEDPPVLVFDEPQPYPGEHLGSIESGEGTAFKVYRLSDGLVRVAMEGAGDDDDYACLEDMKDSLGQDWKFVPVTV
jgi:hypothetical protein